MDALLGVIMIWEFPSVYCRLDKYLIMLNGGRKQLTLLHTPQISWVWKKPESKMQVCAMAQTCIFDSGFFQTQDICGVCKSVNCFLPPFNIIKYLSSLQ